MHDWLTLTCLELFGLCRSEVKHILNKFIYTIFKIFFPWKFQKNFTNKIKQTSQRWRFSDRAMWRPSIHTIASLNSQSNYCPLLKCSKQILWAFFCCFHRMVGCGHSKSFCTENRTVKWMFDSCGDLIFCFFFYSLATLGKNVQNNCSENVHAKKMHHWIAFVPLLCDYIGDHFPFFSHPKSIKQFTWNAESRGTDWKTMPIDWWAKWLFSS